MNDSFTFKLLLQLLGEYFVLISQIKRAKIIACITKH